MILLNLELNDVNRILSFLGQGQYNQVADLMEKIRNQAVPQAQAIADEQAREANLSTEVGETEGE